MINGHYTGFGGIYLLYDGHAGYDYTYPAGTPIVAPRAGRLCKAEEDPINGRLFAASAWDKFHTFYIDHGTFDGEGWSTWYLHAQDLEGQALDGSELAALEPGGCAEVAAGQVVAGIGSFGTSLPHLHFEVRRYVPEDGPESRTARGIDPYGWQGEGGDPIADNPQAAPQEEPLWVGCGNGRVECDEACDDGNTVEGDGCSPGCEPGPLLQQCFDELAEAQTQLDRCLADPPLADADRDGEPDRSDRCPDTSDAAAVDEAGCSRDQFCSAVRLRGWFDGLRCVASDWRNDEPLRVPRDCRIDGRTRRCVGR